MDVREAAAKLRAQLEARERLQQKLGGLPEEFQVRYQGWCLAECLREYERHFSLMKLVRNDSVSIFLEYIATLRSHDEKQKLLKTLCRRWAFDTPLSVEEQQILDRGNSAKVSTHESSKAVLGKQTVETRRSCQGGIPLRADVVCCNGFALKAKG